MNKKLIEVDAQAFDDLMYWLDRCSEKGHLENCADLVDPWAIFDAKGWRVVEAAQPAAGEPVYQYMGLCNEWVECNKSFYEYQQKRGYKVRTLWAAPPATANGDEFCEGQWWLRELDAMVEQGTPDQRRAVAVVRSLIGRVTAMRAQGDGEVQ